MPPDIRDDEQRATPVMDRVAAILLLRRDGAALLQHRDNKPGLRHANMWGPPGGHAEPGESMSDCARRELQEETGYNPSDIHFLTSYDDLVEGWPVYRLNLFWCWYDGVQPITCHEGQGLAFIERTAAANYPIPAFILSAWDAALAAAGLTTEKTLS